MSEQCDNTNAGSFEKKKVSKIVTYNDRVLFVHAISFLVAN